MGWFTDNVSPYIPLWGAQVAGKKAKAQTLSAGNQAGKLGESQKEYYTQGMNQALGEYGRAKGAYDSAYGKGGSLSEPGVLEQLYSQRQNGADPYYNRMSQQGLGQMQQAAAQRGSFNAGGQQAAEGNFLSGLQAQMFQQQAGLAGAAQAAKEGRVQGGIGAGLGLGSQLAGTTMQGYGMAGGAYERGQVEKIQSQLAAAGLDVQTQKAIMDQLFGMGQIAAGVYGSKGK